MRDAELSAEEMRATGSLNLNGSRLMLSVRLRLKCA